MAKKAKEKKREPQVSDVLGAVHRIAPPDLAEEWDNVGLHLGHPAAPAGQILVALEATTDVVEEAATLGARTLVTHHPLLFRPPKSLAENAVVPALAAKLIRANVALIAAHTNLDSVALGTNGELADRLDVQLAGRRFIRPAATESPNVKLAAYVPLEAMSDVFKAITRAGAGKFEKYEQTTFRAGGTTTYRPLDGANPTRGSIGELVQVEEVRLEALCPLKKLPAIIRALQGAHPYEEPVFDIIPIMNVDPPTAGLGLIGSLKKVETIESLIRRAKKALGIKSVGLVGNLKKTVETVAICTGSGGDIIRRWREGTADLFITGEMTHHDCAEAHERGVPVLLVGHWASEVIVCGRFAAMLAQQLTEMGFPGVTPVVSKAQRNPLQRV